MKSEKVKSILYVIARQHNNFLIQNVPQFLTDQLMHITTDGRASIVGHTLYTWKVNIIKTGAGVETAAAPTPTTPFPFLHFICM